LLKNSSIVNFILENHLLLNPCPENNENNLSGEWIISPLNKIPIRANKLKEKSNSNSGKHKKMQEYLNLK